MLNKSFHIESSMIIVGKKTIQEYSNKSIPIKCAKYQIFRIWHTKHQKVPPPWDVPNVIIFATHEQYRSIFGTVHIKMIKKKIIHFLSLPLWLSFVSLFLFLLSFSATPFFSITLSSFFLLLSSPESSPLPFFFPFFCHSMPLSLSLSFSFLFSVTFCLSSFFST